MAWVLKMEDATIESGLVHDFDASLSGIGQELGAGAYSMRLEPGSTCKLQLHNAVTHSVTEVLTLKPPCLGVLFPLCWVRWFLFVLGFGVRQSLQGATVRLISLNPHKAKTRAVKWGEVISVHPVSQIMCVFTGDT